MLFWPVFFSPPAPPPPNKSKLRHGSPPTTLYREKRPCCTTGRPLPPRNAPPQVKRAIAAANSLVNKPYRLGGGHRKHYDSHYDCSGSTSFVLKEAGLLTSTRHSKLFLNYGQKGAGDWISVYAKNGHVFMVICGLRFDTTGSGRRGEGPRWRVDGRNARNFLVRHPTGL